MTRLGVVTEQPRLRFPSTRLSAFTALAVASVTGANAADREYPKDVGGWIVAVSGDADGCFATRRYDRTGGTTLLLGLDVDGTNRLTVLNDHWSIRPKDRLELTFRLSKASFPKHFAVGIRSGEQRGFVTSFGAGFPAAFAASQAFQIDRGAVPVERLDLAGSGAAVAALRRCVDAQRPVPGARRDKRPASAAIPKDPFAASPKRGERR